MVIQVRGGPGGRGHVLAQFVQPAPREQMAGALASSQAGCPCGVSVSGHPHGPPSGEYLGHGGCVTCRFRVSHLSSQGTRCWLIPTAQ